MNAPDRSATVRAFYAAHPEHFTADRHDENRRRSLPALIAHLEATHPPDRGKWGVLVKTDRNNKVPCDVIVWKDTDQSIDIMDSQGGLWAPHDGTIHLAGGDAWFWAPASVVDPNGEEPALHGPPFDTGGATEPSGEVAGGTATSAPAAVDLAPMTAKLDALSADVAALRGLVQQLLDRPAPSAAAAPDISFPRYEGSVSLGPLGNQAIVLRPKSD
jgi:hypothetical protein